MTTTEIGAMGEDYVCEQLEKRGYEIAARNFRSRLGEIDIIAEKDETLPTGHKVRYLCFIEVKTRSDGYLVSGFEAITPKKQRKIIKTAEVYIAHNKRRVEKLELQPRFDCAEVHVNADGIYGFDYIEGAFWVT